MLPSYEDPNTLGLHGGKADQVPYLKSRSRKKLLNSNYYLVPGDAKYLEGVDDVKFYVLGPPKDVKWIRSLERKKELYPEGEELDEETSMEAALLASGTGNFEDDLFQKSIPFKEKYRAKVDEAKKDVFFIKNYGFSKEEDHGSSWRRIDDDWLWTAEHLALDLDTKTNNTSLVLAIELRHQEPYKVLLFAADAQVGNWLSWYSLSWGKGEEKIIKIEDLLERTVLYKVGHHGSHNATLKRKGLEKMINKELVSMLPVDEKWAHTSPGWEHPAKNLLSNLNKKSRGRVIRTDQIPCTEKYHDKPSEVTEEEWEKFLDNLNWDKDERLWIEYNIE
jgi:hypothetical protein